MHGHYQKRYANEIAFVRNGQIQNVHVGDRLHFGEAEHHINDQCITEQADNAHDRIQNHRYQITGCMDGGALVTQTGIVPIHELVIVTAAIEFWIDVIGEWWKHYCAT